MKCFKIPPGFFSPQYFNVQKGHIPLVLLQNFRDAIAQWKTLLWSELEVNKTPSPITFGKLYNLLESQFTQL